MPLTAYPIIKTLTYSPGIVADIPKMVFNKTPTNKPRMKINEKNIQYLRA